LAIYDKKMQVSDLILPENNVKIIFVLLKY